MKLGIRSSVVETRLSGHTLLVVKGNEDFLRLQFLGEGDSTLEKRTLNVVWSSRDDSPRRVSREYGTVGGFIGDVWSRCISVSQEGRQRK